MKFSAFATSLAATAMLGGNSFQGQSHIGVQAVALQPVMEHSDELNAASSLAEVELEVWPEI